MRCLVIANAADADPGFVGHRLRHHGFVLSEAHREHPDSWPAATAFDLVVLLGSEWSVYWEAVAGAVDSECALVRDAAHRGVPILGICFGAQLVSHAFGGSVQRASAPEIGWYEITSEQPEVIGCGPWLQWHYDTFSVPAGFSCVATSAAGPQVMTRDRILTTQFHPEATESIIARWSAGEGAGELARLGRSVEELMDETRRRVKDSGPECDRLVDWFVESVIGSPVRR